MKSIALAAFLLFTIGCNTPIIKPDLSPSWADSKYTNDRYGLHSQSITIVNTAADGEYTREGRTNFSYNNVPLKVNEPTRKTIENDIKKYLSDAVKQKNSSDIVISVYVNDANSYEAAKVNGTAFIPLVGMFTGNDTKIFISLNVKFEIEKNGKVVKKWHYVNKIEKETNSSTTREQDYAEIIRRYRQDFFEKVDAEILGYLNDTKGGSETIQAAVLPNQEAK